MVLGILGSGPIFFIETRKSVALKRTVVEFRILLPHECVPTLPQGGKAPAEAGSGALAATNEVSCGVCGLELRGVDGTLVWRQAAGLLDYNDLFCVSCLLRHLYGKLPTLPGCSAGGCHVKKCTAFILWRAEPRAVGETAETREVVPFDKGCQTDA